MSAFKLGKGDDRKREREKSRSHGKNVFCVVKLTNADNERRDIER